MEKVCPVVCRGNLNEWDVLGFVHPSAGNQFVKGTVEEGEDLERAAKRELEEESGLIVDSRMIFLGTTVIGPRGVAWHFFAHLEKSLPDSWDHFTADDHGHTFSFFWHPLKQPLDGNWHPIFHQAFAFFAPRVGQLCASV